jgi:hypothetical protein
MHRFRARIYKIGLLRCVDVPAAVSRKLGDEVVIPVRGHAQGIAFRSTLTARGKGRHRLYVHSRAWRKHGLDAGDLIDIRIERDDEPRDVETPKDFLRALEDRPLARAYFLSATDALRREIANWLAAAKQKSTRERRIERAMDALEQKSRRPKRLNKSSAARKSSRR